MTGTPKIDPLSKKIAELVTQRELQALGIRPTAPILKKPTHVIPKPQPPSKPSASKAPVKVSTENPQEALLNPFSDQNGEISSPHISAIPYNEASEKINREKIQDGSNPLNSESNINEYEQHVVSEDTKEERPTGRNRKKSEDMQNNVENLARFQEELQREYPELGLNNSIEGSSFHTNELNELEEACKELSSEHHDTKTSPLLSGEEIVGDEGKATGKDGSGAEPLLEEIKKELEGEKEKEKDIEKEKEREREGEGEKDREVTGERGKEGGENDKKTNPDEISNKSEYGGSVTDDKTRGEGKNEVRGEVKRLTVTKIELGGNSENIEANKKDHSNNSKILGSKRPEGNFTPSKLYNANLLEFPSKDFANLQYSFKKASMLHAPQEVLSKTIPRCHINLSNCQSSPLYFSIKAPPDSKLKCGGAIGPVDSLRRLLLKTLPEEEEIPQDFYGKSLEWLKARNQRLDEIRNTLKDKDLENCTFDPYFEKHESQRREKDQQKIFEFRAVNSEIKNKDSGMAFAPRIPENIQTYSALSPADYSIKYQEGFGIEKFVQQAKPMVPYRSINFLN